MTVAVPGERSTGDGVQDVRDTLAPVSGVGLAIAVEAPATGTGAPAVETEAPAIEAEAPTIETEAPAIEAAAPVDAVEQPEAADALDAAGESAVRVIKRYSNRKLYDTKSSRYVTLPQIADLLRNGENVQIVDNRTKEDKTEVTLALIISEELRLSPRGIPLATLTALITRDTDMLSADPAKVRGLEAEIHRLNDRLADLEQRLAAARE